jgi:hypothetical protein
VPAIERDWEVTIAGEGQAIGTVRAPDDVSARSLAIVLAEAHCLNVGVDLDPEWVQVRPKDPAGLLIIRAWIEYGSSAPLRVELSTTSDVSNGIVRKSVHSDVVEVGDQVQAWLREVLTGR